MTMREQIARAIYGNRATPELVEKDFAAYAENPEGIGDPQMRVYMAYRTADAVLALFSHEPTEGQVERAVDLAMSWQPSERGLSYAERRREVMGLLVPATRAMPLQQETKS